MASGYNTIIEGKARIAVPRYRGKDVSSRMPVFYNPVMKSNRDITLLLMAVAAKLYGMKKWRIADPFAATGIRGIRMLRELGRGSIEMLKMNDYSAAAVALIKKNLKLNKIKTGNIAVENTEANKFLLNNKGFNYVDIDPFGYPGIFLDAAVKKTGYKGILAVTATDTSALAGTAVAAGMRKYLATPLKNSFMHETGIRVLIRLVQLVGAMHEKALLPVFSYYKEHYIRAFFMCRTGAHRVDELLGKHKELLYCNSCCEKRIKQQNDDEKCGCGKQMAKAGPLWAGNLFDKRLASEMAAAAGKNDNVDEKTKTFLKVVAGEAANEDKCGIGFYAIEDICEKHGIGQQPKTAEMIKRLRQKGYSASATHCTTTGVKTNATLAAVVAATQQKGL
ncbi:tRNA (guanine(10)-N(2))-dimethyltransferase [Candidatus Woesearchaeota archaeon]|nr:tRNA (guanine(10)-N(2))-dimethyltransferase [Candidatus Woesearchaeota archaeon]